MSTNDTLRGLLTEARELLGDIWDASYDHDAGDALRALAIGERIDAALAEPVADGVVLPELRPRASAEWHELDRNDLADDAFDAGYNKCRADVAALNGGAVAGQQSMRTKDPALCEKDGCFDFAMKGKSLCWCHQLPTKAELINQCDGCQAGIPVVNGSHRMGKPGGYPDTMKCVSELYAAKQGGEDE